MSAPTLTEKWLQEAPGFSITKAPPLAKNDSVQGDNRAILAKWMPKWAPQMAANFARIRKATGVKLLSDSARGLPAIVVGIGPSLDKDVDLLKYAPAQAIVICTDAALRVMQRHGIRPHIVLQLDCKVQNRTMFEHVDTRDLVLVANSCIHPEVLAAWKGKAIFYNMALNDSEFMTHVLPYIFPQFGAMESKACVGNLGVLLAHLMGCSRVIGVGLDLCYGKVMPDAAAAGVKDPAKPIYRYRCTDYAWQDANASLGMPGAWVEKENKVLYDNDDRMKDSFDVVVKGQTYKVDGELDLYRKSLLEMIGSMGIEYTNCAVDGVLREDVETLPFEKALERYCQAGLGEGESIVPHLMKILPDLPPAAAEVPGDMIIKTLHREASHA